jgi:hypothetical protein
MIGTVQSCDKSKSGKSWRVKIDGKYYGAKFDSHLETAIGKAVDFNYKTTDFGEWIESWAYTQAPASAPANTAVKPSNGDRWWLPFVSNQVAHAIAAGRIQTPADMNAWAKAAKECVLATDIL